MAARYLDAIRAVQGFDTGSCNITFVSPVVSVCLATRRVMNRSAPQPTFSPDARSYAQTIGLVGALNGTPLPFSPSGLAGRTYSPLAHLSSAAEVEPCNQLMNELFRCQLSGHDAEDVRRICKVVGELHDNVASHARGMGFSAAQVLGGYLYFAIADNGCGFRRNAAKVAPEQANSDGDALLWAFGRGNTSAGARVDPWRQRWAPEAGTPYSDFDAPDENHHQGLGLWLLEDLVTQMRGYLWVISGGAQRVMTDGVWGDCTAAPITWSGVAMELALPILKGSRRPTVPYTEPDDLAEELGL